MKTSAYLVAAGLVLGATAAHAAGTFHYSCANNDDRYALTVNTDRKIVKLVEHFSPHRTRTFRILQSGGSIIGPVCGKYGWVLSDGAVLCTATQGYASLTWRGPDLECDHADTPD